MGINIVFPWPTDFPISTIHWSIDHKIWWWNPSCWMVTSAFFGRWHLHMPRNPKICCLSSSIATWCNFSAYAMWIVHIRLDVNQNALYICMCIHNYINWNCFFDWCLIVCLFVCLNLFTYSYYILYDMYIDNHWFVYIYIYHYTYIYLSRNNVIMLHCIWATVEIYCLRQVRHQVSESPIALQVFLFFHVLTIIYLCLSIVLKRVRLDPHPWRSLFARAGAHLCFCPCLSGPPSRCLGGLFNQQVFWKETQNLPNRGTKL